MPYELIVIPELKALIPPLSAEERAGLEANILENGIRDAIVVWAKPVQDEPCCANMQLERVSAQYEVTPVEFHDPRYYSELADAYKCKSCGMEWYGVDRFVVDGHNRYEIAQKHRLGFKIKEMEFADINAVKVFMIGTQLDRRNITDGWRFELLQAKKELLHEIGNKKKAANLVQNTDVSQCDTSDKPHSTRNEIAKETGWSTGKVAMLDKVWKETKENPDLQPIKDAVLSGDMAARDAYDTVKKITALPAPQRAAVIAKVESGEKASEAIKQVIVAERNEAIQQQKAEIDKGLGKPDGIFDVIVIDPPWNYGREYDPESSRVANPYPEMTKDELLKIEIPAADNCVMFLWTTHAFLFDAKELLDKWGFSYKATMVWDKEKMGMGAWLRMQCEFCLVAVKGKPFWNNTTYRDIIRESRREHSRKPESFYSLVESVTAGRKLDYFSRQNREGWHSYGNDTKKF